MPIVFASTFALNLGTKLSKITKVGQRRGLPLPTKGDFRVAKCCNEEKVISQHEKLGLKGKHI